MPSIRAVGPAHSEHGGATLPALVPGRFIGEKYQLLRRVGSGSMGEVWAARHVSLGEEVAIKVVRRSSAHGDGSSAESRFLLEARIAAQLSRKTRHVVAVTDHGVESDFAYLVMELLRGESLDVRLERTGPMPLASVVPLVRQVARALSVVHADGIVHRDLKPSNVFVTRDEEGRALIKILDFGIAKLKQNLRSAIVDRIDPKHATVGGSILGTPMYMSPEQACGRVVDHRADVWALAVIAYHLLTNDYPFDGDDTESLFDKICSFEATSVRSFRPDLPAVATDLFACAFSRRLDARFQSVAAFAGALEQLDTLQIRMFGADSVSVDAISLPPLGTVPSRPAPLAGPPSWQRRPEDAAGSELRRRRWRIAGGGVVLAVLLATASMLTVYFQKDTSSQAPRSPVVGPAFEPPTSSIASGAPAVESAVEVPPGPPATAAELPNQQGAASLAASASAPIEPAPMHPVRPRARPAASGAPKTVNRSEVF